MLALTPPPLLPRGISPRPLMEPGSEGSDLATAAAAAEWTGLSAAEFLPSPNGRTSFRSTTQRPTKLWLKEQPTTLFFSDRTLMSATCMGAQESM